MRGRGGEAEAVVASRRGTPLPHLLVDVYTGVGGRLRKLSERTMGTKSKLVVVYFRVGMTFALHTLFAVLVLIKVTEKNEWSWAAIFSPVFCFDAVFLVYYLIYLCGYVRDKLYADSRPSNAPCFPGQRASALPLVFYGVGMPLKLATEVVLVLHLLDGFQIPFYVVGILLCLLFALLTVSMGFYSLKPTFVWAIDTCWD